MKITSVVARIALIGMLALLLAACGETPSDRPGSTTLGVAQIEYQAWSCENGLILFQEAQIGNPGEAKGHYDHWLSPIPCESAGRYLKD